MSSYLSRYAIDTGAYIAPGSGNVGPQLSGGYNCVYGTSGVRFQDVGNNANEIALWDQWYQEQIRMYGQRINYYINGYNLSAHDFFYGEMPLVRFAPPISMIMALTVSNDNVILSKFGIQGEADLNAIVSISNFYSTITAVSGVLSAANYEPKAGDLIELVEFGSTRPGGRSGKVFEITERVDEKGGQNNQLLGHYIWMLQAKRFDFDYELDAPREALMDQVYDNKSDGLQNNLPRIIETKEYEQFVDKDSDQVFEYDQHPKSDTSVYGDYDDTSTLVNLIGTSPDTGALGASASTYIVLPSESNYPDTQRTAAQQANAIAIQTLYSLLSAYNPSLSALVPIIPAHESTTENRRTPAPITDLTTLATLLSALGLIPPPGP